jgi:hypothetical protein
LESVPSFTDRSSTLLLVKPLPSSISGASHWQISRLQTIDGLSEVYSDGGWPNLFDPIKLVRGLSDEAPEVFGQVEVEREHPLHEVELVWVCAGEDCGEWHFFAWRQSRHKLRAFGLV